MFRGVISAPVAQRPGCQVTRKNIFSSGEIVNFVRERLHARTALGAGRSYCFIVPTSASTRVFITRRPRWRRPLWRNYDELTSRAVRDNRRFGSSNRSGSGPESALYLRPSQSNSGLSHNDDDVGGAGGTIRRRYRCSLTRGIRITACSDTGRHYYYSCC